MRSPVSSHLQVCEHCSYRNAKEYQWQNKTIILAADYASNGIYNFIIPLRAHFRSKTSLNPIILLLERRPDVAFLDALSYFPLVSIYFVGLWLLSGTYWQYICVTRFIGCWAPSTAWTTCWGRALIWPRTWWSWIRSFPILQRKTRWPIVTPSWPCRICSSKCWGWL